MGLFSSSLYWASSKSSHFDMASMVQAVLEPSSLMSIIFFTILVSAEAVEIYHTSLPVRCGLCLFQSAKACFSFTNGYRNHYGPS